MEVLADFTPAGLGRVLRPLARGLVKHLVFLGGKPRAMLHLAGRLVWRGHIRDCRNPALAIGGLQHLTKRDDLTVQGSAGGLLRLAGFGIEPRCLTVRPILLHLAGRYVLKRGVAKEG